MFTPSEVMMVKSAVEAALAVGNAEIQLGNAVQAGSDRQRLGNAAEQAVRAARDVRLIACLLLGAEPEDKPRTWAERLQLAEEHRQRAVGDTIPTARNALTAAVGGGSYGVSLLDECWDRLKKIVPLDLVHADPPFQPASGPVRTVIGPHGDYYHFQRRILGALHYWNDWASYWPPVYKARTGLDAESAGCWRVYASACNRLHMVSALPAGISLYWRWDGFDQFHRVVEAGDQLWLAAEGEGVAQAYHACMVDWCKILVSDPDQQRWLRVFSDSWRNMDRAGRELLNVFPNRPDLSV